MSHKRHIIDIFKTLQCLLHLLICSWHYCKLIFVDIDMIIIGLFFVLLMSNDDTFDDYIVLLLILTQMIRHSSHVIPSKSHGVFHLHRVVPSSMINVTTTSMYHQTSPWSWPCCNSLRERCHSSMGMATRRSTHEWLLHDVCLPPPYPYPLARRWIATREHSNNNASLPLPCARPVSSLNGNGNDGKSGGMSTSVSKNNNVVIMAAPFALTPNERRTFDVLLQSGAEYSPSTCIRIAGGWVRDKLLRHYHQLNNTNVAPRDNQSTKIFNDDIARDDNDDDKIIDIDVALSDVTGTTFAGYLHSYQQRSDEQRVDQPLSLSRGSSGRPNTTMSRIGVVAANPSQSKHLETATLTINNIHVCLYMCMYDDCLPDPMV
jgi:hypothetical protein